MILVFGGTTEGRACVKTLDEAGSPFFYSTRGAEQVVESRNGTRLTGAMNATTMVSFCRENGIRLIIDAAHPFAAELHRTISEVSEECDLPVVRYERIFPSLHHSDIVCTDYDDAVAKIKHHGVKRLLALTGVKTISRLKDFWKEHECFFRILDREESYQLAESAGFPKSGLLTYDASEPVGDLISRFSPDAVITKESGESGGFAEKEEACRKAGIPLFVVSRPRLSPSFIVVTGNHGLRKAVESIVPSFYPLRSGFTTGSCATVAAKAALMALLGKEVPALVPFTLPDGEVLRMPVARVEPCSGGCMATVIKDAGDDPDVTHRHPICVKVSFSASRDSGINFIRGEGVGLVTLPGLGIPVGEPAINITPRRMIERELSAIYPGALDVVISVPDGEELAKRTFNPKLGITGGISIIGTSGIVRPFSSEAFVDAIRREMEVAVALGVNHVVINSGAKSEKYIRQLYPDFKPQAFIHFGNFIGDTLSIAADLGIANVTLGIMMGKAVKLAAGHLDTHSHKVVMDRDFLKSLALHAGCSPQSLNILDNITLAREIAELFPPEDLHLFLQALLQSCHKHCAKVYPKGDLRIYVILEDGGLVDFKKTL